MNLTTAGIAILHPQDANIPVVRLDPHGEALHDQSVLELLAAEHNDDWLYRGQLDRHYRPWPAEDKNGYVAGSYMLDSLMPSDYRGLEDAIRDGKKNDSDVRLAYGDEIAMVRTALVCAGMNILAQNDSSGLITAWHHGLPKPKTNYITSLGQHIGLPSQNMDLTPSPL